MRAKVTKTRGGEKVLREREAHFLTGIRPSWFTCSFSFVYLGRRQKGHALGTDTCTPNAPPRQAWGSRFAQEGVPGGVLSQDVHSQLEQLLSPDLGVRTQGRREWGPQPKPGTGCGTQ